MLALLALALARPYAGVLVYAWVSFMNPHQLAYGAAGSAPWAALAFAATLAGCLFGRGTPRRPLPPYASTGLVIALMLGISLTSLAGLAPADEVAAKWQQVEKVLLCSLVLMAFLESEARIHALVWVIVVSLGYYGVRGGLFALLTAGSYKVEGPPSTMISDNNHLAAALLVTLPLMNFLRQQSPFRSVRLVLASAMTLTLFAVLASYSRGALIGLGAATLLLWWNSRRKLVAGAVLAASLSAAILFMPQGWSDRMSTIQTYEQDESATGRLNIWHASLAIALARPLTGGGFLAPYKQSVVDQYDSGVTARAVHSIYFEVIGEHGFPVFLIWVTLPLLGLVNSIRVARLARGRPELAWHRDLARMSQVSIVAYLTAGTFLSLSYWDVYYAVLCILEATRARALAVPRETPAGVPAAWRVAAAPSRAPLWPRRGPQPEPTSWTRSTT